MKYAVLLVMICGMIRNSEQLVGKFCHNKTSGITDCCYNHEEVNGLCKPCRNGTVAEAGDLCKPCKQNMYGYKCIAKCNCDQFQRCDAAVGCILEKIISTETTTDAGIFSEDSTTTNMLLSDVHFTAKDKTIFKSDISTARRIVTDKRNTGVPIKVFTTEKTSTMNTVTSNMEWLIYTLCIVGVLILTGLSHAWRSYRKRKTSKERTAKGDVILEQITESPYSDIYDEIDEDMLTDDKIYFVPQETHSMTSTTDHDDTNYLDACFATAEGDQENLEDKISHKECSSTSSPNSDSGAENDSEYLNPYHSLQEKWKDDFSHGYDVAVTVHTVTGNSAGSCEETSFENYSHVYQSLQKNRETKVNAYENELTSKHKQKVKQSISSIHGTRSLEDNINNISDIEASIKDSNIPIGQIRIKTIEEEIFQDGLENTETLVLS